MKKPVRLIAGWLFQFLNSLIPQFLNSSINQFLNYFGAMKNTTNPRIALALVTSLFFLWALAIQLNPILIPHLKKACELTDFQSAFVDSAMFIAYFLMAIPAGIFMQKRGYKAGIITGLLLFATGAFLFWPAAAAVSYPFFLVALFVLASGLTMLETAANPYVTVLGDPETATQRLNLAQSFNGLGSFIAPLLGGMFILSDPNSIDKTIAGTPEHQQFLMETASSVKVPFLCVGLLVLFVAVLFSLINLPDIRSGKTGNIRAGLWRLLKIKTLRSAVIAQFFYVGAQVCISSFFIRFAAQTAGFDQKLAAKWLAAALLLFMVGRFLGTFLMQFVKPSRLLTIYATACVLLTGAAVFIGGITSIYCLLAVEFFMSILFPTIFSMGVHGLGDDAKLGSSLIIMAIVGGAVLPPILGQLSDATSIQTAYLVPMAGFAFVALFGFAKMREAVD